MNIIIKTLPFDNMIDPALTEEISESLVKEITQKGITQISGEVMDKVLEEVAGKVADRFVERSEHNRDLQFGAANLEVPPSHTSSTSKVASQKSGEVADRFVERSEHNRDPQFGAANLEVPPPYTSSTSKVASQTSGEVAERTLVREHNRDPQFGAANLEVQEVYSVSQLSNAIRTSLEQKFGSLRLKGEVSGLKVHTSGHCYFTLKDENAAIDAICWRTTYSRLNLQIQDGMEVICQGRVTSYLQRSKYQIIVEKMTLSGEGSLLRMLEERKRKLAAEGIFATERKRPLPFLPKVIGIITSPTGAVIQDMHHRLVERIPCRILLWPVIVQGNEASKQIINALRGFNQLPELCSDSSKLPRPDVIIIARGGGSIEDLWAFNDEELVRATANSQIPIIAAIGHETDSTLIDFAADWCAPTPTAAAEVVLPTKQQMYLSLAEYQAKITKLIQQKLALQSLQVEKYAKALRSPKSVIEMYWQRLDEYEERLKVLLQQNWKRQAMRLQNYSVQIRLPRNKLQLLTQQLEYFSKRLQGIPQQRVEYYQQKLRHLSDLLNSYSYHNVLARGFVYVSDQNNHPITKSSQLNQGQELQLNFHDGIAQVIVNK